jgi:mono/diheme cytochrome c family protein
MRVATRTHSPSPHPGRSVAGATRRALVTALGLQALLLVVGCRQDMHDQPRYKPLAGSDFFADGRASRPLVAGTVARGFLRDDARLYAGKDGAGFLAEFPVPVDLALVQRGRERYDIFCSPCHGRTGQGNGMVVQRGYRRPPSLHIDRLRREKPGYVYDVITSGFGIMPDYAAQIPVQDRWAIVSYVRALQLSQNATLADVPQEQRQQLDGAPGEAAAAHGAGGH